MTSHFNSRSVPNGRDGPVRITITCQFKNARFGPVDLLRWILKRAGRIFGARVSDYSIEAVNPEPDDGTEGEA